jgi:acetyl/propionyl-CoA carboxylase alpha subunit
MEFRYQLTDEVKAVRIDQEQDSAGYKVTIGDKTYIVEVTRAANGDIAFSVDNRRLQAYTAHDGSQYYVSIGGLTYLFQNAQSSQRRKSTSVGSNAMTAAMPGQVLKVLVAEGDSIRRGQALVILEAMKMEIRVTASDDGHVTKVLCSAGDIVERGQRLIELSSA